MGDFGPGRSDHGSLLDLHPQIQIGVCSRRAGEPVFLHRAVISKQGWGAAGRNPRFEVGALLNGDGEIGRGYGLAVGDAEERCRVVDSGQDFGICKTGIAIESPLQ